jgi:hypothetical protein
MNEGAASSKMADISEFLLQKELQFLPSSSLCQLP